MIREIARRGLRYVDYYVPTKELAEEVAAEMTKAGISARIFHGRSSGAPEDPMCAKYEAAEMAAKIRLRVYRTLCKRPLPGGGEQVCPYFNTGP